jgi:hypothetical protein
MAPFHIPLWRCFYGTIPPKPPIKILHFLLRLKSDGEGETCASEHALKFWKFCCSQNITDGSGICRLFILTFEGRVRRWCKTLLVTSIHTWEYFMLQFWHAFENYDYDYLCAEISELRKNKVESLKYFLTRFMHLFYRFPLIDRSSINDLILHLTYLTNETYQLMDEESKSCLNFPLHAELNLHENVEIVNGLVKIHMSRYLFIMGYID